MTEGVCEETAGPSPGAPSMERASQRGGWRHRLQLHRIPLLDFPEWLAPTPVVVSQVLFAVLCAAVAVLLRLSTDVVLPGAGPFALTVPTVLVATLFGRLVAGVICLAISSLYAWYFVLPVHGGFDFVVASDGPRVVVNIASGFFVVCLAELFRRTMRQALSAQTMLLVELEHRVKNNFASVASLLRLQLQAAKDEGAKLALGAALGRLESFARANSSLYRGALYSGEVEMRDYLEQLCASLQSSFGEAGGARIHLQAVSATLPRDRAIVIGLLVNEVATNSMKHAFSGRADGSISVSFEETPQGYRLTVGDDGGGMIGERRPGSLGLSLIDALTRQAGASTTYETGPGGTVYRFDFPL